jgi:hypothetical protein
LSAYIAGRFDFFRYLAGQELAVFEVALKGVVLDDYQAL